MSLFTPSIHAAAWVQATENRTQGSAARRFKVSSSEVGKALALMYFEGKYAKSVPGETVMARVILREEPDISTAEMGCRISLPTPFARKIMRVIRFEELCLAYIVAAEGGVT